MVCLGGYGTHWVPSLNLDELCGMLWDMARYHNYDVRSPYNRDAALWVANQTGLHLPDRRPPAARPPAPRSAGSSPIDTRRDRADRRSRTAAPAAAGLEGGSVRRVRPQVRRPTSTRSRRRGPDHRPSPTSIGSSSSSPEPAPVLAARRRRTRRSCSSIDESGSSPSRIHIESRRRPATDQQLRHRQKGPDDVEKRLVIGRNGD